jgi:hypothetical protein
MDLSRSESPIPTENVSSRLAELEAKLASQEARNTQTLDALNTTLRLLTAVIPTQSTALPQPPLPVASATRPKLDLKPSPPPNFDGDRQKGKGFINACQAYFRLRPDQFPDEQTKVQWAMTYMNQGRAQKWANRVYHWEAAPANVGNPHFVDWDDFRSRFRTEFFPLHSDAVATNRLEGTSYFQGRRTVDDYLDDFRDLISDSGYADPKTIVVKFRRGLNPSVADAVATMASGRPDDLDPDAWYEAAIRFDQNQAANAAFRSAHFAAPQPKTTVPTSALPTRHLPQPNRFPPRFAHTTPTPGNPVPMDVDAARRAANKLKQKCYRCGKIGHFVNDCPQPLDVRSMNREEVDIWMEQLNARMDEINLLSSNSTSDKAEASTEVENPDSDFPIGGW